MPTGTPEEFIHRPQTHDPRSSYRCIGCECSVYGDDSAHVVCVPALDDPREAFFIYSCARCWPAVLQRLAAVGMLTGDVTWGRHAAS